MQDFDGPRSPKTQNERTKRSFSTRQKFGKNYGKKSYRSDSEGLEEHSNQSHENHFGGRTGNRNNFHSSGERSNSRGRFNHNNYNNRDNNGERGEGNGASENRNQKRFGKLGFKKEGFKREGQSRDGERRDGFGRNDATRDGAARGGARRDGFKKGFKKGNSGKRDFRKENYQNTEIHYGHKDSYINDDGKKELLSRYKNNEVKIDNPYREDASVLTSEVRLNKFISNSGKCSRREADTFISAGVVTVNGETITEMGFKVKPGDDVRFNGERIHGETKVYIVMNKPKGFVTSVNDPHASDVVLDLISSDLCPQRVYPVGRLDKDTTGVLLFTNDGELTERLTHPSFSKRKIYQADLNKDLTKEDMQALVDGVELEDGMANVDEISYIDNVKSCIGVEIHNGKNRIVRRLFESLGYKVKKLDRVYFAGMTKKNLKRGQWRFLTKEEVNMLRMGAYE